VLGALSLNCILCSRGISLQNRDRLVFFVRDVLCRHCKGLNELGRCSPDRATIIEEALAGIVLSAPADAARTECGVAA
jgi:hypothetical protein